MKKAFATARAHAYRQAGFTLIELLVVIAIIALLTGIILTALTSSKAKSRDAERVSDLGQIQLALELYFDRCHQYPTTIQGTITSINNGCPTDSVTGQPVNLSYYISAIPTPPTGAGQSQYSYITNVGGSITYPTDYVLYAQLESVSSASANSLGQNTTATKSGGYAAGFNCDNAKNYCVGPK